MREVELAALPGDAGPDGPTGGLEAGVVVTDAKLDATEAALDEALEEGPPMNLGFAEGDADAQQDAFAVRADAPGQQDGAIDPHAVLADLFVADVQDEIGIAGQRSFAPLFEFGVQELAALATWVEPTLVPQSGSTMAATRRVETPRTYISASASLRARSERRPFSRALG